MSQRTYLSPILAALLIAAVALAQPNAPLAAEEPEAEEPAAEEPAAGESEEEEESGGFFSDIKEGVSALADKAAAQIPDVPAGAVIAFNRDECPGGWSDFPPAVGRAIIGAGDLGDGNAIAPMAIGGGERAAAAPKSGASVTAGAPWLGLLICEKD